jgi:hypothetical protein
VGRAIRQEYPKAQIDCIDRDAFLTSICRAVNQRDRIPGTLVVRDLNDDGWLDELPGNYDVVAAVNALHWFDAGRAAQLVDDVHGTLREGGQFLLAEGRLWSALASDPYPEVHPAADRFPSFPGGQERPLRHRSNDRIVQRATSQRAPQQRNAKGMPGL